MGARSLHRNEGFFEPGLDARGMLQASRRPIIALSRSSLHEALEDPGVSYYCSLSRRLA